MTNLSWCVWWQRYIQLPLILVEICQQRANLVLNSELGNQSGIQSPRAVLTFISVFSNTAGHDLSFAKHDSVVLVPQPTWEGPGCHWQACGLSCWSWCQHCELCVTRVWTAREDLFALPDGTCFACCAWWSHQGQNCPRTSEMVPTLSGWLWKELESEDIEVNGSQQSHFWAYTPRKPDLKETHAPPMFIAALFIIARTWKQPRCPWQTNG